jgi:tetratricopeptide (TPR) repeat protein
MRVLALAIALAASSAAARAQAPILMLRIWIDAVDRHTAGEADSSVDVLNAWTYNDLESMRPFVEYFVEAPIDGNPQRRTRRSRLTRTDRAEIDGLRLESLSSRGVDFHTFRKRAAILHTDTAMVGAMPRVVDPPHAFTGPLGARNPQRRVDVMSSDGRLERFELANPHWDYARDMLDSLPRLPARDPIVAQWSRTIGAYYASERKYADALGHFGWARSAAPGDPLVLYGEACLQETLGAPRIQDYVRVTTLPNGLRIIGVASPQTHLGRAETLLRKSLASSPRFAEANLRLGRVMMQLQKHEEALPYLQTAIAESRDRSLSYYAHLFSGDAESSLARGADARQSYERALAIFPDAQAAQIGLAAVISTGGNREAALAAMMPTLTKAPDSRAGDDPWWDYYDGDAANLERLLDELRAPFMGKRQ